MNFWERLSGHKTHIMSIITLIIGYLLASGYIDKELSNLILGICGALLLGAISHGVKKNGLFRNTTKVNSKKIINKKINGLVV